MNKIKLIYIEWFDACFQFKECVNKELEDIIVIYSCGVFVRETKKSITIAQDVYDESKEYEKSWRYIKHIPKVNIIKKKIIEI